MCLNALYATGKQVTEKEKVMGANLVKAWQKCQGEAPWRYQYTLF